jgi:hypothetical protein
MSDRRRLGCAALIGAAIAFPAGMMLGGGGGGEREADRRGEEVTPARAKQSMRDFYSPNILDDPYVIEQQLRVVEALELSCRHSGERCREARQARRRVEENGAR